MTGANKTELALWVVYDHPQDYPDKFVARLQKVSAGNAVVTDEAVVAHTLEELREYFELRGLYRINRFDADAPHIVEVWV